MRIKLAFRHTDELLVCFCLANVKVAETTCLPTLCAFILLGQNKDWRNFDISLQHLFVSLFPNRWALFCHFTHFWNLEIWFLHFFHLSEHRGLALPPILAMVSSLINPNFSGLIILKWLRERHRDSILFVFFMVFSTVSIFQKWVKHISLCKWLQWIWSFTVNTTCSCRQSAMAG